MERSIGFRMETQIDEFVKRRSVTPSEVSKTFAESYTSSAEVSNTLIAVYSGSAEASNTPIEVSTTSTEAFVISDEVFDTPPELTSIPRDIQSGQSLAASWSVPRVLDAR